MNNTTAYRWGRLAPESVQQWADLVNTLARADGTEEYVEAEDLAEELTSTTFDPELDSWAIWSGPDLVGYGHVIVPRMASFEGIARMFCHGGIHPDHRRQGLGRSLIEKQESRALDLARARHPGLPTTWIVEGGLHGAGVRDVMAARGYRIVRYFSRMVRGLDGSSPPVQDARELASDIRLLTPGAQDRELLRRAHNDAFRDHWGAGEKSPEAWEHERSARCARPAFDSMALNARAELLAYVLCAQWVPRELQIDTVGTVRDARGRGLAHACLSRTISAAAATGEYDLVDLWVDSDSPTGATRLYERVAFTRDKTLATMHRPGPRAT